MTKRCPDVSRKEQDIAYRVCFSIYRNSAGVRNTHHDNKTVTTAFHIDVSEKMNQALGHFCAYTGLIGPIEPPEDGEMSEMALPSRHRIKNSNPGGLRPSTLPLRHGGSPQY